MDVLKECGWVEDEVHPSSGGWTRGSGAPATGRSSTSTRRTTDDDAGWRASSTSRRGQLEVEVAALHRRADRHAIDDLGDELALRHPSMSSGSVPGSTPTAASRTPGRRCARRDLPAAELEFALRLRDPALNQVSSSGHELGVRRASNVAVRPAIPVTPRPPAALQRGCRRSDARGRVPRSSAPSAGARPSHDSSHVLLQRRGGCLILPHPPGHSRTRIYSADRARQPRDESGATEGQQTAMPPVRYLPRRCPVRGCRRAATAARASRLLRIGRHSAGTSRLRAATALRRAGGREPAQPGRGHAQPSRLLADAAAAEDSPGRSAKRSGFLRSCRAQVVLEAERPVAAAGRLAVPRPLLVPRGDAVGLRPRLQLRHRRRPA